MWNTRRLLNPNIFSNSRSLLRSRRSNRSRLLKRERLLKWPLTANHTASKLNANRPPSSQPTRHLRATVIMLPSTSRPKRASRLLNRGSMWWPLPSNANKLPRPPDSNSSNNRPLQRTGRISSSNRLLLRTDGQSTANRSQQRTGRTFSSNRPHLRTGGTSSSNKPHLRTGRTSSSNKLLPRTGRTSPASRSQLRTGSSSSSSRPLHRTGSQSTANRLLNAIKLPNKPTSRDPMATANRPVVVAMANSVAIEQFVS